MYKIKKYWIRVFGTKDTVSFELKEFQIKLKHYNFIIVKKQDIQNCLSTIKKDKMYKYSKKIIVIGTIIKSLKIWLKKRNNEND